MLPSTQKEGSRGKFSHLRLINRLFLPLFQQLQEIAPTLSPYGAQFQGGLESSNRRQGRRFCLTSPVQIANVVVQYGQKCAISHCSSRFEPLQRTKQRVIIISRKECVSAYLPPTRTVKP